MKKDKKRQPDLDKLITNIIETFDFYGIKITSMELTHKIPEFNIIVIKDRMKYDLKKTLDLAYWALQKLIYSSGDEEILLNYKIIESLNKEGDSNES